MTKLAPALALFLVAAPVTWGAPFNVDNTADAVDASPGDGTCATAGAVCTLRAAVQEANAWAGSDTISIPAGTYATTLAAEGDYDLTEDVTISGAGSAATIVDGGALDRVFDIQAGVTTTLSDLTIRNGDGKGGKGGGIRNVGTLTISDAVVTDNTDSNEGCGILNDGSGGPASLTITNSTISDHTCPFAKGGGLHNIGDASTTFDLTDVTLSGNSADEGGAIRNEKGVGTLTNVTISGNSSDKGGGILNRSTGATLTLTNVTISGNTSTGEGGGIQQDGTSAILTNVTITNNSANSGGGIKRKSGTLQIFSTIVAGNPSGSDCDGTITSGGYNLDSDGACGLGGVGDISAGRVNLGALADNGGPTETHALLAGSDAIDAVLAGCPPPGTDQRGMIRPRGANCDMGSFEAVTYSITGTIFEDVNYGGGAGRDLAGSGGAVVSGATVELYDDSGNLLSTTATDGTGVYDFPATDGSYSVRVVNETVDSTRTGAAGAEWPVQTFRTDAGSGTAVSVTDHVGGEKPEEQDAPANSGAQTLADLNGLAGKEIQSLAPVTVSGSDVGDADFGFNFDTIVNTNGLGQGSLHEFLDTANALANAGLAQVGRPSDIENAIFMLADGTSRPGMNTGYASQFIGGIATIAPDSALPTVSDPAVIDATLQPGYASTPIIEISGGGAGAGANALTISAGDSTVRGLVINGFDNHGIELNTSGGNTIQACYIGTNAAGTADAGNNANGIEILTDANTVGGDGATQRNVISGNDEHAIEITGAAATDNVIQGNYVGTNAAGDAAVGNSLHAVYVAGGAQDNTIGGTGEGAGNVISGNGVATLTEADGVYLTDPGTSGNVVKGNFIGTDAAGTGRLGNSDDGVGIEDDASGNIIGGSEAGAANVIGDAGAGNLIGGQHDGVYMEDAGTTGNVVQGNFIGTDLTQTIDLGNGDSGVRFWNAAVGNPVGGTADGEGNVIANNLKHGILLNGDPNTIEILRNSIYGNGMLGIDLDDDGVTANDGAKSAGQANLFMDFPVFTSVVLSGTNLSVEGYVGSAPSQAAFANSRVEVFLSDEDVTGFGEGQTYLGFLTTDAGDGDFSGSLAVSGVSVADMVTGTATDAAGNSSEFGANAVVQTTISGTVFEDVNGDSGLGDAVAAGNVRVRLYEDINDNGQVDAGDSYIDEATTNATTGVYNFGLGTGSKFLVAVDSKTVPPSDGFNGGHAQADIWSEQTYGDDPATPALDLGARLGGRTAGTSDDVDAASTDPADNAYQHLARVDVSGGSVSGVDFAFSFRAVTHVGDSDDDSVENRTAQGSLRQLIQNANAIVGAPSLGIPAGTYTLTLTGAGEDAALTGDLDITEDVTLAGTSPSATAIDGNRTDRVLELFAATVQISDLTVEKGESQGDHGGGILVDGDSSLTLVDTMIRDNDGDRGGGIRVDGDLVMSGSTLYGNRADQGGAIQTSGSDQSVTLTNVTVSGNTAVSRGGGVELDLTTLTNVTITGNASPDGGGIYRRGGSVFTVKNSIVAGNPSGGDCSNVFTSAGYNLDGDGTCALSGPGDISSGTANLGPLADNGGPTLTHALLAGSDAIDAVTVGCPPPATDQRGVARPIGLACDIGAYEGVVQTLKIVKRAFQVDGTSIPSGSTLPRGMPIKFMLFINNPGGLVADVSMQEVLDPVFLYVAGSTKYDNSVATCALIDCTAAEEAAIFAAADSGTVGTDAVNGDVVSFAGVTLDVGNGNVANAQLDIAGGKVWAMVFTSRMQ